MKSDNPSLLSLAAEMSQLPEATVMKAVAAFNTALLGRIIAKGSAHGVLGLYKESDGRITLYNQSAYVTKWLNEEITKEELEEAINKLLPSLDAPPL